MAPKKADLASKKAETAQELSPSALELLLPLWDVPVLQDSSVPGVYLVAVQYTCHFACLQLVLLRVCHSIPEL